ncbi:hypothetical protein BJ508DRAFT_53492 [Ascobolus immersus RN42]|uniref:DUF7580 domain-containing protein n=1 Tax=Ascobolus immersus RN42 TaxID=1160509 RepID=A0A3N4HGZ1_ASCIM|nr:hypothetical protein BJ508DRAFT_53492 [Ascobolus immersus RN42]
MAFEAAGLALGAITLICPIVSAYRNCSALCASTRCYIREFRRYSEIISAEEQIFRNECRLLVSFWAGIDGVEATKMMDDSTHPIWHSEGFLDNWNEHPSREVFDPALKAVQDVLDQIDEKMRSMPWAGTYDSHEEEAADFSVRNKMYRLRGKVIWQSGLKAQLDAWIENIKDGNYRIARLRKQHQQLSEKPRPKLDVPVSQLQQEDFADLEKLPELVRMSEELYKGLESVDKCSCHLVQLELKDIFWDPSAERVGSGGSKRTSSMRRLDELSKSHIVINTESKSARTDQLGVMYYTIVWRCARIMVTTQLMKGSLQELQGPGKKTTQHAVTSKKRSRKRKEDLKEKKCKAILGKRDLNIQIVPKVDKGDVATEPPLVLDTSNTMDNICKLMGGLSSGKSKSAYLGYIATSAKENKTVYRHALHREDVATEALYPAIRTSLVDLLPRIFPKEACRLAYLCASSLLSLGSVPNTWFFQNWSSKDIILFQRTYEHKPPYKLHVLPRFSAVKLDAVNKAISTENTTARDPQLFALAIVLIELAFCKAFRAIIIPGGALSTEDFSANHTGDYLRAKAILDTGLLKQQAGTNYALIVERCVYGDFGLGNVTSFSDPKMRELFYLLVVLELKGRLEIFEKL